MAVNSGITRGRALRKGDCIGIIAPSAPAEKSRFAQGLDTLHQLGFRSKVALDPAASYGTSRFLFASDSVEARVQALHNLYADPDVAAIIAVRGAYSAGELLEHIDWGLISDNPKPLIGFSDVTALLLNIATKSRVACIHGPVLEGSFTRYNQSSEAKHSVEALIALLLGLELPPIPVARVSGETLEVSAPLMGGSLSTLTSLIGTPYEPALSGSILFLEDVGERPHRVHRMLMQLKLARVFERVSAVLLGNFRNCEYEPARRPHVTEVFDAIFKDVRVPVASTSLFGHSEPNLPLPLGIRALLSPDKLEFLEPTVIVS